MKEVKEMTIFLKGDVTPEDVFAEFEGHDDWFKDRVFIKPYQHNGRIVLVEYSHPEDLYIIGYGIANIQARMSAHAAMKTLVSKFD